MIVSNNSIVTFSFFHSADALGRACWCDFGYASQNLSNKGHGTAFALFGLAGGASGGGGTSGTLSRGCPEVVPRLSLLPSSPPSRPDLACAFRIVFSCRRTADREMNSSKLATVSPSGSTVSHPAAAIDSAKPSRPAARSSHAADLPTSFPSAEARSWNLNQTSSSAPTTSLRDMLMRFAISRTCDFSCSPLNTNSRVCHMGGMCWHLAGWPLTGVVIPTGSRHCNRSFREVQLKSTLEKSG